MLDSAVFMVMISAADEVAVISSKDAIWSKSFGVLFTQSAINSHILLKLESSSRRRNAAEVESEVVR